jgi:hypothetical protein
MFNKIIIFQMGKMTIFMTIKTPIIILPIIIIHLITIAIIILQTNIILAQITTDINKIPKETITKIIQINPIIPEIKIMIEIIIMLLITITKFPHNTIKNLIFLQAIKYHINRFLLKDIQNNSRLSR